MSRSAADHNSMSRRIGVVVLLTLGFIVTALFVGHAWQKETRAWELAAKNRLFDVQLLENPRVDAARLESFEILLDKIAQLSRTDAEARRTRLYDAVATTLRDSLMSPGLSEDDLRRFDAELTALESRLARYDGRFRPYAEQLRSERDARLEQWNVLFDLQPPFDSNSSEVFPEDHVAADDVQSLKRIAQGALDYAPTKVECPPGEMELHVAFDRHWTRASLIGASLNYTEGRRYDFLIAVPSFDYRDTTPGELAQLPSFEEVIGKRSENRLNVYILRDGLPLRKETARIDADRLRLTARRSGNRLEFTVNDNDTYAFVDPFPLTAGERGVFAVYWPRQVQVERLRARWLRAPQQPGPLERGDELYAQGLYSDALEVFRTEDTLEAAYKGALCQFALGRTEAFLEEITQVGPPPPSGSEHTNNRWRLLAACRLLQHRVESRQWDDVRKLLAALNDLYGHEQIALIVPAMQQELILQYFRRRGGNRGGILGDRTSSLEDLTWAALAEDLFGEDPTSRRMTKWRLAGAHRNCECIEEAQTIFRELLAEDDVSPLERTAMLADLADMLSQNGQSSKAIEEVNAWLLDEQHGYRTEYLPLLVIRAVAHIASGQAEQARSDLDHFLSHVDVRKVDHSHYAHACGLRGILFKEQGDTEAAMKVWRQGLRRNWHEGYLEPQKMAGLRGFEAVCAHNSIEFDGILGSWTGEMTQDEAYRNMWNLYPGSGVFSTSFRKLVEVSFEPEFVREIMMQSSKSPLGEEQGRTALLRQTADDNTLSFVMAFVRISCLRDVEQTPEVELILERSCRFFVENYFNGTYDDTDLKDLLNVWRGRFTESTFLRLARKTHEHNPELAASAAFAFGCKYAREGEVDVARYLFEYALSIDQVHPAVDRLTRLQLESLEASVVEPTTP